MPITLPTSPPSLITAVNGLSGFADTKATTTTTTALMSGSLLSSEFDTSSHQFLPALATSTFPSSSILHPTAYSSFSSLSSIKDAIDAASSSSDTAPSTAAGTGSIPSTSHPFDSIALHPSQDPSMLVAGLQSSASLFSSGGGSGSGRFPSSSSIATGSSSSFPAAATASSTFLPFAQGGLLTLSDQTTAGSTSSFASLSSTSFPSSFVPADGKSAAGFLGADPLAMFSSNASSLLSGSSMFSMPLPFAADMGLAHPELPLPLTTNNAAAAKKAALSGSGTRGSGKAKLSSQAKKLRNMCPYEGCGKCFSSRWALQRHESCHNGLKPYVCPVPGCERGFGTKDGIRRHRTVHSNEKPHSCPYPECPKRFKYVKTMRIHVKSVHTGERAHGCEVCGKRFVTNSNLKDHLKRHLKTKDGKREAKRKESMALGAASTSTLASDGGLAASMHFTGSSASTTQSSHELLKKTRIRGISARLTKRLQDFQEKQSSASQQLQQQQSQQQSQQSKKLAKRKSFLVDFASMSRPVSFLMQLSKKSGLASSSPSGPSSSRATEASSAALSSAEPAAPKRRNSRMNIPSIDIAAAQSSSVPASEAGLGSSVGSNIGNSDTASSTHADSTATASSTSALLSTKPSVASAATATFNPFSLAYRLQNNKTLSSTSLSSLLNGSGPEALQALEQMSFATTPGCALDSNMIAELLGIPLEELSFAESKAKQEHGAEPQESILGSSSALRYALLSSLTTPDSMSMPASATAAPKPFTGGASSFLLPPGLTSLNNSAPSSPFVRLFGLNSGALPFSPSSFLAGISSASPALPLAGGADFLSKLSSGSGAAVPLSTPLASNDKQDDRSLPSAAEAAAAEEMIVCSASTSTASTSANASGPSTAHASSCEFPAIDSKDMFLSAAETLNSTSSPLRNCSDAMAKDETQSAMVCDTLDSGVSWEDERLLSKSILYDAVARRASAHLDLHIVPDASSSSESSVSGSSLSSSTNSPYMGASSSLATHLRRASLPVIAMESSMDTDPKDFLNARRRSASEMDLFEGHYDASVNDLLNFNISGSVKKRQRLSHPDAAGTSLESVMSGDATVPS